MAEVATLLPVLAAPFMGSFLGVLIRRLPRGRPVAWGRSRCESCGASLRPSELVPLASFVALRGRCRACAAPIGVFHPAIELAALTVAAWAWSVDADAPGLLWVDCGLGWALLALAWIDWEWLRLPDALTLPLLAAGLSAAVVFDGDAVLSHVIGAALGYAGLRLVAIGYRVLRGRDGLGAGDAKLLGAAGAWVGWQALPQVLLLGAAAGLLIAGARRLLGWSVHAHTPVPFGPPLALALWIVWLYGGIF